MIIISVQLQKSDDYKILYNSEKLYIEEKELVLSSKEIIESIKLGVRTDVLLLENIKKIHSNTVLICTEGEKEMLLGLIPDSKSIILELKEHVSSEGDIDEVLKESEMNKVLRSIFERKSSHVYVSLTNAFYNPLHENNIANVLEAAGYEVTKSSTLI